MGRRQNVWAFLLLTIPFVIGIPALLFWMWRGKYLPKEYVGPRLEDHRSRLWRSSRHLLIIWGLMVLLAAHQIIDLCSVSRDAQQFWRGFFVASDLFLIGFMIAEMPFFVRRFREGRQQRDPKGTTTNVT
jgi:hypothetical protein